MGVSCRCCNNTHNNDDDESNDNKTLKTLLACIVATAAVFIDLPLTTVSSLPRSFFATSIACGSISFLLVSKLLAILPQFLRVSHF